MGAEREGVLFVIAAPSGTGKSTLCRRLVDAVPDLVFSISYTTRAPRPGERDGDHYHFVDRERFESLRREGGFVESAEVFGELYGTGLAATWAELAAGRDLLLDIDVQGARQVRGGPVPSATIMVLPPDWATLVERLRLRGSEDGPERDRRLATARREAEEYVSFDYVVINADLEQTVAELAAIVRAERRRTVRCAAQARAVLGTFPN